MAEGPMTDPHPRTRLDDNFAGAIRFSMMAALRGGVEMDFGTLAHVLQAGDSAVSKAIAALSDVGYVLVRKGQVGARPRTWVRASALGSHAFEAHVQALQDIVASGGGSAIGLRPSAGSMAQRERPGTPGVVG